MNNYIVTHIKVEKRGFLESINHGLAGNMNKIEISLEKSIPILIFWTWTIRKKAKGVLHEQYDIHNYIKKGSVFNLNEYPTLSIIND